MNILQQKWFFLNSTSFYVPQQIKKLYHFGLASFAARKVESISANARLLPIKWATAKSKAWRLTKNEKLVSIFPHLLYNLRLISSKDVVAVDFSDFGGNMNVLMFAKQTGKGRALPLYFDTLRYPIEKDSQNIFIIQAIERFGEILGFKPILVFDRGFACPSIIRFLSKNQWKFVICIKKGKFVFPENENAALAAESVRGNDVVVEAYYRRLRLIVSDKEGGVAEPWYLITNEFTLSHDEIIGIYYHRFEIEEFFRDAKRLLGLEDVRFKTERSLKIVLWFLILGFWCLWHIEGLLGALHERERRKMGLSRIRYILEKILSCTILAVEREFMPIYP